MLTVADLFICACTTISNKRKQIAHGVDRLTGGPENIGKWIRDSRSSNLTYFMCSVRVIDSP